MKYLNLALFLGIMMVFVSCNGNTKKSTHIETSESIDVDGDNIEDSDEIEYLESAMNALDEGDKDLAVQKIMEATDQLKSYIGEMDNPEEANIAIDSLMSIATKIKNGDAITSEAMEEMLIKLAFFSDDDLDFDGEEVNDNSDLEE